MIQATGFGANGGFLFGILGKRFSNRQKKFRFEWAFNWTAQACKCKLELGLSKIPEFVAFPEFYQNPPLRGAGLQAVPLRSPL